MTNNPKYELGKNVRVYFSLTIGVGWPIDINHAIYRMRVQLTNNN